MLGTQVSVFDVSDLRRPTLLTRQRLDGSWSEVEWDHHAFLYWPRATLAVLPVQATVGTPAATGPSRAAFVAGESGDRRSTWSAPSRTGTTLKFAGRS